MAGVKCANCEALRERVREMEREMGVRMQKNSVSTLVNDLGIRPLAARAIMVLYQSNGRFIPTDVLIEAVGYGNAVTMRASLSFARKVLGKDGIIGRIGAGYSLSPSARELIAGALA